MHYILDLWLAEVYTTNNNTIFLKLQKYSKSDLCIDRETPPPPPPPKKITHFPGGGGGGGQNPLTSG